MKRFQLKIQRGNTLLYFLKKSKFALGKIAFALRPIIRKANYGADRDSLILNLESTA